MIGGKNLFRFIEFDDFDPAEQFAKTLGKISHMLMPGMHRRIRPNRDPDQDLRDNLSRADGRNLIEHIDHIRGRQ